MDPAAAEVLGRLTAEYVEDDRFPDAFFRDLSRLLTEIRADELDQLSSLCAALALVGLSSDAVRIDLMMRGPDVGEVRFWNVSAGSGQVALESILGPAYRANDASRRLVGLLANTGLVERVVRGEPTYVDIRRAVIERIANLVRSRAAASPDAV